MNDVAEACGLPKPSLCHYFRGKDELLASIPEEHVERLSELVKSVEAAIALRPQDRPD